jgi:5,10-methylene-tetrahydrofolate dehydrogenase/methenyl tetrahydrofolate cyclohydrolase
MEATPTGRLDCVETTRFYRDLVARNVRDLGFAPGLALVLGSEDPGSVLYRDLVMRDCHDLGIRAVPHVVDSSLQAARLLAHLNQDGATHGLFVFYPLGYADLKDDELMDMVAPGKDIEGLHAINIGYLNKFRKRLDTGVEHRCMVPCTGRAVVKLVKRGFGNTFFHGKTVLVVNDSLRIGRPLTSMVANLGATPILCHQFTRPEHLEGFIRVADVIVSAVPVPGYRIPTHLIQDHALCIDLSHAGNFDAEALGARGILHTDTRGNSVGKVTRTMALLNLTYAAGWEGRNESHS